MGGVAAVRWAALMTLPSSALRCGQKGTAAAGAAERERVRALGIVGLHPAQHGVGSPTRAPGHLGGAAVLGDVKQGERALTGAGMGCAQSQVTQVVRRLTPARAINTDHEI